MDYAIQIATKGIIGSTVGLTSRGYIVTIADGEFIPPIETPSGPGRRGFREEERKKRKVKVCVEAYGQKFCHEEIISFDHKITVKDLEITELGDNQIRIEIKKL